MDDDERFEVVGIGGHVFNDSSTKLCMFGLVSIQLVGEGVEEAVSCKAVLVYLVQEGCVGGCCSRGMCLPLP